jgi:transcriptional regulator with XRE-family HTH domain
MLQSEQLRQIQALAKAVSSRSLSQKALAEATGVHQSQISRILAGQVRFASKNVVKLCKYAEALPVGGADVSDPDHDPLAAITRLLGHGRDEDLALARVIASLTDWRKSWRASL